MDVHIFQTRSLRQRLSKPWHKPFLEFIPNLVILVENRIFEVINETKSVFLQNLVISVENRIFEGINVTKSVLNISIYKYV